MKEFFRELLVDAMCVPLLVAFAILFVPIACLMKVVSVFDGPENPKPDS